jgi:hypothetical protein
MGVLPLRSCPPKLVWKYSGMVSSRFGGSLVGLGLVVVGLGFVEAFVRLVGGLGECEADVLGGHAVLVAVLGHGVACTICSP